MLDMRALCFRKAEILHLKYLREIAYYSEKYWGFSDEFMKRFEEKFNITESFLEKYPVYIGMEADIPVCFWGVVPLQDKCELEYFYVDTKRIGNGYGAVMWKHLIAWCKENDILEISLVTSSQAVGFYEKMGAWVCGETLSVIDGRMIPKLLYTLE